MIWLCLVPVVGLVIQFLVINGLAATLRNEYMRRGLPPPEPCRQLGLVMCIAVCCCVIPILGSLAVIAVLVTWIMYWAKITEYSRRLEMPMMYCQITEISGARAHFFVEAAARR